MTILVNKVLILVLMEDTLRALPLNQNELSFGVLILVLMEDTLREAQQFFNDNFDVS